jgi:transposase
MARHQRDLRRERTRRRHIERQRSSGQTIRMYCEFHRLRETSFYFWRQEIAKRDRESATRATAATPAPAFVPIEIRLAEGHRVRVRSGCDRGLLADVLALLRRSASEDRPC